MDDALKYYAQKGDCEEVYEVVRTAIVVRDGKTYRVEVWKSYSNSSKSYTASCYAEDQIEGKTVWVEYLIDSTNRDDADGTLAQALGFLPKAQRATA